MEVVEKSIQQFSLLPHAYVQRLFCRPLPLYLCMRQKRLFAAVHTHAAKTLFCTYARCLRIHSAANTSFFSSIDSTHYNPLLYGFALITAVPLWQMTDLIQFEKYFSSLRLTMTSTVSYCRESAVYRLEEEGEDRGGEHARSSTLVFLKEIRGLLAGPPSGRVRVCREFQRFSL